MDEWIDKSCGPCSSFLDEQMIHFKSFFCCCFSLVIFSDDDRRKTVGHELYMEFENGHRHSSLRKASFCLPQRENAVL